MNEFYADGFLSLYPKRIHAVGEVYALFFAHLPHDSHASVEIRIDGEHYGAVRNGLNELRDGYFLSRQKNDGRDIGRRGVRSQRGGSIARRRAGDGAEFFSVGHHLLGGGYEDRHAEVLEGAGVAVSALLDPQLGDSEFPPQAIRPEKVRPPLIERDDVFIVYQRADPLFLAPNAAAVRPDVALVAVVEQMTPLRRASHAQGFQIVRDVEEAVTFAAPINGVENGVCGPRIRDLYIETSSCSPSLHQKQKAKPGLARKKKIIAEASPGGKFARSFHGVGFSDSIHSVLRRGHLRDADLFFVDERDEHGRLETKVSRQRECKVVAAGDVIDVSAQPGAETRPSWWLNVMSPKRIATFLEPKKSPVNAEVSGTVAIQERPIIIGVAPDGEIVLEENEQDEPESPEGVDQAQRDFPSDFVRKRADGQNAHGVQPTAQGEGRGRDGSGEANVRRERHPVHGDDGHGEAASEKAREQEDERHLGKALHPVHIVGDDHLDAVAGRGRARWTSLDEGAFFDEEDRYGHQG